MAPPSASNRDVPSSEHARLPQLSRKGAHGREAVEVDPTGQSPEDPIEFAGDNDVARGNEERANAEPEPAALHDAQVPGKPDVAKRRREKQHDIE